MESENDIDKMDPAEMRKVLKHLYRMKTQAPEQRAPQAEDFLKSLLGAAAPAPVEAAPKAPKKPRSGKVTQSAIDATTVHRCPVCRKTKPVLSEFGTRVHRGIIRTQSWCRSCRNRADYHKDK